MIIIQQDNFTIDDAYDYLAQSPLVGAVNIFVGRVRESQHKKLESFTLEHYPAMAYSTLEQIKNQAMEKYQLNNALIIHRYGILKTGDKIVLCGAASPNRSEAINATQFMMDFLKTEAPFWKLEQYADEAKWVESRESDIKALDKYN